MNQILHQWKWDFRRIRTLWVLWLALLAAGVLGTIYLPAAPHRGANLGALTTVLNTIAIFLFGVLLVAHVIYNTPFSGTQAIWKTRPLTRASLFWTKTIALLVLIFCPVLISKIATWHAQNLGASFTIWAAVYFGALSLAMFFLAAAWAALCEKFGTFFLCFAGTGGFLAVAVIVFNFISSRTPQLPLHLWHMQDNHLTSQASTNLAMVLIILLAAAAAWFLSARLGRSGGAVVVIAVGVILSASANHLWQIDVLHGILGKPTRPPVNTSEPLKLNFEILDPAQPVPNDIQLFSKQLGVRLPKGQTLNLDRWHFHFGPRYPDRPPLNKSDWQQWNAQHQHQLRGLYPDGTHVLGGRARAMSEFVSPGLLGTTGILTARAKATLFQWKRRYSLPVRPGSSSKLPDSGLVQLASADGDSITVSELRPPPVFLTSSDDPLELHYSRQRLAYILYNEDTGVAVIGDPRGSSATQSGSFSTVRESRSIRFDPAQVRELTGGQPLSGPTPGVRLDVYHAERIGEVTLKLREDNWVAHDGPRNKPDAVAPPEPITLPNDPTPAQVDAYLDSLLFNWRADRPQDQLQQFEADLQAIGSPHLGRLLARLPVDDYLEYPVYRCINALLEEGHKDAVLAALTRDEALSRFVKRLGWEAEAAPILAEKLAARHPLSYQTWVPVFLTVASQCDPATYPDLRWHFVHATHRHRTLAKALAQCEDFPLYESVAEAWQRYRYASFDGEREELAGLAARTGDKEALRIALVHYATTEKDDDLEVLAAAVAHPANNTLPAWIHSNFKALTFNPNTRKFELN